MDVTSERLSLRRPATRPRIPWWVRAVPFFLSAFFFLSAMFAVFSPLPLLFAYFKAGRRWAVLAALTNCAIVWGAAGTGSLAFFLILCVTLALAMGALLQREWKVDAVAGGTLLLMFAVGALGVGIYSWVNHLNYLQTIAAHVTGLVEQLAQSASTSSWLGDTDVEEWKRGLVVEFPSAIAIFCLVMVWSNLLLILRLNPEGIRDRLKLSTDFFPGWKAPEWLVWPTLVCGVFLIWEVGVVSDVALNVFKFLMAVYALQGLSILAAAFDAWKVRGTFRAVVFLLAVFFMMPLLLSLGFFDLWFDFRGKFRQSS